MRLSHLRGGLTVAACLWAALGIPHTRADESEPVSNQLRFVERTRSEPPAEGSSAGNSAKTEASAAPAADPSEDRGAAPRQPAPAAGIPEQRLELPRTTGQIERLKDIHPASFQDVTPGETSLSRLKQLFGEPLATDRSGKISTWAYQVGPFPKVEMLLSEDIVSSIVIHLETPERAAAVADELGLHAFQTVVVTSGDDRVVGQAYPERGLQFVYDVGDAASGQSPLVSQLVLETITADPFVWRVKRDTEHRYQQNLTDLRLAQQVDPTHGEAFWLEAELLRTLGRHQEASRAAERAVQLSGNSRYRLTQAAVLGQLGRHEEAIKQTRQVMDDASTSLLTRARAEYQLGNLLAEFDRDYQAAIQHHLAAIKLATPLARQETPAIRQAARMILIDGHLEVANDIAWGRWKDKETVVPKWLQGAIDLADRMVQREDRDPTIILDVHRRSLAAYAGLNGELDESEQVAHIHNFGQQLLSRAQDPWFKARLQWELGEGLYDAVRVAYARADYAAVRKHGEEAVELLEPPADSRDASSANYLLGRVYFLLGASYAVDDRQHAKAVLWYERAAPRLEAGHPPLPGPELGRQGERFISMGVSYWQSGAREEGLRLTQKGSRLMEKAMDEGHLDATALAVAYNNLANMHRKLGNVDEARSLTARAERLSTRSR